MEIMLGEMAALMDHHHSHHHHHHGPTRPAKAPTWTTLSPTGSSGSSDDAAELFPWSNELKQTLRMRLQACYFFYFSNKNVANLLKKVVSKIVGDLILITDRNI